MSCTDDCPANCPLKKGSYTTDGLQLILFGEPYLSLFSGYFCAYCFWELNQKGFAKSVFSTCADGGFWYSVFYISALCQTYIILSLGK